VILNTYAVQTLYPGNWGGGSGAAMLALPGQVWVGSMFGGLQQWDSRTGTVARTFPEVTAKFFYDIQFDGKNLWVLASQEVGADEPDSLYVIQPADGKIVTKIDAPEGQDSEQLGISPGKVWYGSTLFDTSTFEATEIEAGLPGEPHFAYDGQGWMWITGVTVTVAATTCGSTTPTPCRRTKIRNTRVPSMMACSIRNPSWPAVRSGWWCA
jgi:hypothetical protein